MTIIYRQPQKHYCHPGWESKPLSPNETGIDPFDPEAPRVNSRLVEVFAREGDVWKCKCGKTWVAYHDRNPGNRMCKWRKEGWFAKWRREKQNAN